MADEPENLTLLHLRAIDIKLDRLAEDVREIKTRLASWSSSTPRSRPATTTSMPGSIASRIGSVRYPVTSLRVKQNRPGKGRLPGRSSSQVNDA